MKTRLGKRFMIAATAALCLLSLAVPREAHALDLNRFSLDSIATWGRFPRFCVNTYRWGNEFFNGYDTTYVQPTGYRFNVKFKTDSWLEYNAFRFDDDRWQMNMVSYPSTSAGFWLTYMAVSVGYDVNVSKMLNLAHSSRKRLNAQFSCMLFSADFHYQTQNSSMRINRVGPPDAMQRTDIDYDGLTSKSWGLDTYYFFNHKHYSQAAAFNYGRLQRRSSGSLYAGLSFSGQEYRFDFAELPQDMLNNLPEMWPDYTYHIHAHNYAFKVGYGYNFVLRNNLTIGLSEAPSIGLRYGYVNDPSGKRTSFYAFNSARASVIWNKGHWFAGAIGRIDTNLFADPSHTLVANILSFEASIGYRFNLW